MMEDGFLARRVHTEMIHIKKAGSRRLEIALLLLPWARIPVNKKPEGWQLTRDLYIRMTSYCS